MLPGRHWVVLGAAWVSTGCLLGVYAGPPGCYLGASSSCVWDVSMLWRLAWWLHIMCPL